ncbi:MAG TPA: DUF262 domain-containing protein [Steroidobacteraceae bacterium]|nr:DUF262 domain-containing protein [Steroidobacteraceae bacterium]
MKSCVTSYNGLFDRRAADGPIVERIEIPIIQRDYAQGRQSDTVTRIRSNFLDVLHDAVTTGVPIGLDFVYGDVEDGTLRPLDGQQRLTTLFLLHWYLAWRADRLEEEQGWKRFEYATRPSARRFCACLVESKPPSAAKLRSWFEDQHWFLHTWQYDPTIRSMLLMLEAIHVRFSDADCALAWERLVDSRAPAISFHLLPIKGMGLSEDLYIKMNSRGKPLTRFENFKARFEQVLENSCPKRVEEFAQKVDGAWADLLWPLRGSDDIVDDEFLRYFHFVADICSWLDDRVRTNNVESSIETIAELLYGAENENASQHLDFLMRCFDTWIDVDTSSVFSSIFSLTPSSLDSEETGKVVLFGAPGTTVNLFVECCKGQFRRSWPRTLLLYGVLLHRLHESVDFSRRLRLLRNLIEASSSELRADKMPALLLDVRRIIIEGALEGVSSFNQAQVAEERLKIEMLLKSPGLERPLFHLEDHRLLRGCLSAFEFDESVFEKRATAFQKLYADEGLLSAVTGALLASGDYALPSRRFLQLGSSSDFSQWREILTGSSRAHLIAMRRALGRLLDFVADGGGDVRSTLENFTTQWLAGRVPTVGLDWRWYFVRYPAMRAGFSGIYAYAGGALSYGVCMLDKKVMSSHYRDPYLSAIRLQSGVSDAAVHGSVWQQSPNGPWFTGYETEARWMRFAKSGAEVQCVQDGLLLRPPAAPYSDAFSRICEKHGIGPDFHLTIPQVTVEGYPLDTKDRVQLGAALVRDLVNSGL